MGGVCRSETAAVRLCLLVQLFCLLARYVNCTALRLQWVTDVGSPVVGTPVIAPHGLVHVPTTSSGLHTLSGRTGSIVESSNAAVGMLAASPIRARVRVDAHPIEPTLGPAASNARHTRVVMLQLGYSGAIVESSAPLPPSMASQDRSYGIRYTDAFHDQSHGHLFADAQVVARVPRLRVRTDWHSGLQFDHEVDHSNADVSKNMTSADIAESIDELSAAGINVVFRGNAALSQTALSTSGKKEEEGNDEDMSASDRKLMQAEGDDDNADAGDNGGDDDFTASGDEFGEFGHFDDFDNLPHDEQDAVHDLDKDVEHGGLDPDDLSDLSDEYLFDLDDDRNAIFEDDFFGFDSGWESMDEWWLEEFGGDEEQEQHQMLDGRVGVDAHLLTNGALSDIDGDGDADLVLPVSYFFDDDYYSKPEHKHKLKGIEPNMFLASGVVVFEHSPFFHSAWEIKWKTHLDLSTANASRKAYALSPPTLADIDADGQQEVILGTSVGFVYMLRAHDGSTVDGYPLQMDDVQAQIAVEDVNSDGALDLIACDMSGVVAAFTAVTADKLWERHLGSSITQAASIGDVNGDGELEVVVTTTAGGIHVLNANNGEGVFHTRTGGSIVSPPLLTRLNSTSSGLHIVSPSFDGFLYAIDGRDASKELVDMGERTHAMPLTHDLDNDGLLDIVVATMSGSVFSIETLAPAHPLSSVREQSPDGVPLVARSNWKGVYAFSEGSRWMRDVFGRKAAFPLTILDTHASQSQQGKQTTTYTVRSFMASDDGDCGQESVRNYSTGGRKIAVVPVPPVRGSGLLEIHMTDSIGRRFSDCLVLSFHNTHYRVLKWIVTVPMVLALFAILHATKEQTSETLPGGSAPSGTNKR